MRRAEGRAAGVDADDGERVATWIFLDDLVRDTYERAAQIVAVEDDLFFTFSRSFLASLDRVKGTDRASLATTSGWNCTPA